MTRLAESVTWCAVAVALVGGCADRTSEATSEGEATTSAASSPAQSGTATPGGGTAAAPATDAAPATSTDAAASHCASATAEVLQPATQLRYGDAIVQPFTIDTILCSGDWARARIPARSSYPQSGMVLYRYIEDGWRAVQFGSGFNCEPEGVPAPIAAELGC